MSAQSHRIEVFAAPMCGACHQAIDYFHGRGLEVQSYEIRWDPEQDKFADSENAREYYRRCGPDMDFVPQIFIDGTHIKGWKQLSAMIDSGKIEELLS